MNYFVKHKKICAFVTAFLVTAVLLLSGLFIVTHAEHECTGEDCPVCAELQVCAAAIRLLTEAAGTGTIVIFAYRMIQKILLSYQSGLCLRLVSLVSLKIRLDT
ncbi:MAG: AraC family transcriptional regulator [Eubacteriales bacterium]|nr:AraC family transcriptional regulator [Eubacteriales bacterium]